MKAASCRSQASSSTKNLSAMGCLLSLPFDYVSAQCAEGGNLAMVASAADAAREAACADGGGNLAPAVPVQVRLQDLCCHAPRFWQPCLLRFQQTPDHHTSDVWERRMS